MPCDEDRPLVRAPIVTAESEIIKMRAPLTPLEMAHSNDITNPLLDKLRANLINESDGKYNWILT